MYNNYKIESTPLVFGEEPCEDVSLQILVDMLYWGGYEYLNGRYGIINFVNKHGNIYYINTTGNVSQRTECRMTDKVFQKCCDEHKIYKEKARGADADLKWQLHSQFYEECFSFTRRISGVRVSSYQNYDYKSSTIIPYHIWNKKVDINKIIWDGYLGLKPSDPIKVSDNNPRAVNYWINKGWKVFKESPRMYFLVDEYGNGGMIYRTYKGTWKESRLLKLVDKGE